MRQLVKAQDRKLMGVAGGVADYFDMDKTIVRAAVILGCIVFPPLVLAYFAMGMVVPEGRTLALPPDGGSAFTAAGEPGPGLGARPGYRKLTRSRERWIAGVAGGIAEHFHIDPTIVRGLFLAAFFAFGAGLLIYVVLAVVMPQAETVSTAG